MVCLLHEPCAPCENGHHDKCQQLNNPKQEEGKPVVYGGVLCPCASRKHKAKYGTIMRPLILSLVLLLGAGSAYAESVGGYDVERLATAIYHAEGGARTAWPYGILARYKTTTPRQACINTIRHKYRDWVALGSNGDYLAYLQTRYAPLNVANDPKNLNSHWLGNVRRLYEA